MKYTLLPCHFKQKEDPRVLLYKTKIPVIEYAKKMQEFSFYQALEVAENIANNFGYILVPSSCIHWARKQMFSDMNRRVKIGKKAFFMLKINELNKNETIKLEGYIKQTEEAQ